MQQADEFYENLKEWWQHQISLNENTVILEGQLVRNSAGLNLKVNEIIVVLKNNTMVEKSSLNVTGQLKSFHDDVIKQQIASLKNKTPFEKKLMQYCANDTNDEKYKDYGQKMKDHEDFRFQAINVEKKYLAQSPEYHLEKLNRNRNA